MEKIGRTRRLICLVSINLLLIKIGGIEAAATDATVRVSPSPTTGTTVKSNVDPSLAPQTITTISVTNSLTTTGMDCSCQNGLLCLLACASCASDTCTNPCGATYQCTLASTVPASAASKLTFTTSSTTMPTSSTSSNICVLQLTSALTASDYDASGLIKATVTVQITRLNNGDTQCSGTAMSASVDYNIAVTLPTTTSTTTSTTTTRTSTSTVTTSTPSTSTTTKVTTTTSFIDSPAGIGTIAAATVGGVTLLLLPVIIVCNGCCSSPSPPPAAEAPAKAEPIYTINNDSGYTYYNLNTPPPTNVNANYLNFPNNSVNANFAKTRLTPLSM